MPVLPPELGRIGVSAVWTAWDVLDSQDAVDELNPSAQYPLSSVERHALSTASAFSSVLAHYDSLMKQGKQPLQTVSSKQILTSRREPADVSTTRQTCHGVSVVMALEQWRVGSMHQMEMVAQQMQGLVQGAYRLSQKNTQPCPSPDDGDEERVGNLLEVN